MPSSTARCPAGISGFFEICTSDDSGVHIKDPVRVGARGGGFAITRGVTAAVKVRKSERLRFQTRILGRPELKPTTTQWALQRLADESGLRAEVHVDLHVRVPIGAGYGTSAAGTAAALLAFADAAQLPVTYEQLGRLTHTAEIENRTGLGTASALYVGGFVLVTEPGAPGVGKVDRLLFPQNHMLVCAYLEPMPTKDALGKTNLAPTVNPSARRILQRIRTKPTLDVFLEETGRFGEETGFATPDVIRLQKLMISSGAVGAAQNMIGKAVHAVVEESRVSRVVEAARSAFPRSLVFSSPLDVVGVRLSD